MIKQYRKVTKRITEYVDRLTEWQKIVWLLIIIVVYLLLLSIIVGRGEKLEFKS